MNEKTFIKIFNSFIFFIVIITVLCVIEVLTYKNSNIGHADVITKSENSHTRQQNKVRKNKIRVRDNKKEILLVNRQNRLYETYLPKDLIIPNIKFISNGDPGVKKIREVAGEALEKLFNAAENENIVLLGVSGYRNYNYQVNVYNNSVYRNGKEHADNYVAQPGASEHQTGLSIDIVSTEYTNLDENFVNTRAYKWLKENCYKYGFIIRYPKEKENVTGYKFEPWHIRYVGVNAATEIMNRNITLEEYCEN
ncbi:M15 family metallopeptidase [Clostridium sporogenes]|uniref:M15 family metallopeptidase n=1 Tax=Clostridium sporogenes TaxID=1509 RepID=UPI002238FB41|nr:M15 family metallopeptidase [Clostridium sporogenes]MCW6078388.1 M15 family metallopeptidase [Clostridium sporogenes]